MVKVFAVLGLALLAGGAYAVVDGWPYLVLERGFTQVIMGALAATAGLILLALAAILAELRRLKGMVTGALAMLTLADPGRRDEPGTASAPGGAEAPRDAGRAGLATTLAAGAGAVAVGGALAGLAQPGEAAAARPEPSETPAASPEPAEDAAQPTPARPLDHDDWLSPPDATPVQAVATEAGADAEPEPQPEVAAGAEPTLFGAELLPAPEEPAAMLLVEAEAAAGREEDEPAPADADEAQPDLALEPPPTAAAADEDRVWWPRLDRFDERQAASGDDSASSDEFGALRDELAGAPASAKSAPEFGAQRRDHDPAVSWAEPRPWPPVTQPRSPEVLDDLEAPAPTAEMAPGADEPNPEEAWQTPAEPAPMPPAAEAEPAPAEQEEPAAAAPAPGMDGPAPEERAAASEEGVIGAYQVGETHFTMYADGSIHARTPDGDYVFGSMDELKTYLASEKNRLEPRAG